MPNFSSLSCFYSKLRWVGAFLPPPPVQNRVPEYPVQNRVNAGWYMGSYTADVDLRPGGPQSNIMERISWVLIYQPRGNGQLRWLVATCVCSSDDRVKT